MHQKALEVLAEIFSVIGEAGLSRDLPVYLPGLSHTLTFVNLATRPLVLQLFDDHILRLPASSIRPALKALILSLLPVIEEETSEDFEQCLRTFDRLRSCFAQVDQESFFWQTLFVASIANSHRRAGVLVYASRYLPKLTNKPQDDQRSGIVTTPEPGLLVRCFATGLCDDNALVQRGFLDLLDSHLPLNAYILQDGAFKKDLDVLVEAALMIVLRRDMGLNRRLWTWFNGGESKASEAAITSPIEMEQTEMHNTYFSTYGLSPVNRAIESMLQSSIAQASTRTVPYRVMLSLMDKWELGGPVVRTCFQPLLKSLMQYQSTAPTQNAFDEVFRSANVFFDAVESSTMFLCLANLLQKRELELLSFIIGSFDIELADRVHFHVAQLCIEVIKLMQIDEARYQPLSEILDALTTLIAPTAFQAQHDQDEQVATDLLRQIVASVAKNLESTTSAINASRLCTPLERAIIFSPSLEPITELDLVSSLNVQTDRDSCSDANTYIHLEVKSRIVMSLLTRQVDLEKYVQSSLLELVPRHASLLWMYLASNTPQYHVSNVDILWRLHELTSEDGIIESTILQMLNNSDRKSCIENFGTFYHHTKTVRKAAEDTVPELLVRPVLRILDTSNEHDRIEPGTQWLLSSHVLSLILRRILVTSEDKQHSRLTLQRVRKLVRILRLVEKHWLAFSKSTELPLILNFSLHLLETETTLQPQAFELIRALYEHETNNSAPAEVVSFLVERLSGPDNRMQEEALDTLLAILNNNVTIPVSLVDILLQGLSSLPLDERLDKWTTLLCNVLPNQGSLLPNLLKTTTAFCRRIDDAFSDLQNLYNHAGMQGKAKNADRSIANLMSGLEFVVARAHQKIFHDPLSNGQGPNGTGADIVSGRSLANHRLTVILCMQDVVRVCARQWLWKSKPRGETSPGLFAYAKSFQYSSTKLRARSRKTLENMIQVEPQECLETLIGMSTAENESSILDLLQTLNGARPRVMLPVIFTAIESRTSASLTTTKSKSTISIQISSQELVNFLNKYTTALEDDMLDEIWPKCAAYLKEVLANPMPYRQILIKLLSFCSIIAQKMDNTSFSEDSRMHRELADLCTRLFTAIFTIKPSGFDGTIGIETSRDSSESTVLQDSLLVTLVETLPHLNALLAQSGRLPNVYTGIASNITTPALRSRVFPRNILLEHLQIMQAMSAAVDTSKSWKKDLLDCFNNARFFQSSIDMAAKGWLPLLRQLQIADKATMTECFSHISPPGAAGVVLGLGASAARADSDRRTQLELKRITSLVMAADNDAILPHLKLVMQKIEEMLAATVESSPSLATRGDLYVLIRALLWKTSPDQLTPLWPILDAELQALCKDILAGAESKYNPYSKLQGAKLLDLLLLLRPDEFQLHEWLFVTDTIDAIYPSTSIRPVAFADEIAPALNAAGTQFEPLTPALSERTTRKPWLHGAQFRSSNPKDVDARLSGFFGQLSIRAFEDLYSLRPIDEEAISEDLLADVFTDSS